MSSYTSQSLMMVEQGKPLVQQEITVAAPQAGEVSIKVHASGLNPVDWKILDWNFFSMALPHTMGVDYAGEVVAVGDGVTEYAVGDHVVGMSSLLNPQSFGQYITVPLECVSKKLKELSFVDVASLPVAAISAYDGLVFNGNIKAGDTVFIPGGFGGVGHFAVQIAKALGAKVIATAGKEESIELLKKHGIDHIINYKTQDIVAEVMKLTDGKGADWTYDATYMEDSFITSAKVVRENGTYIALGTGPVPESEAYPILKSKNANFVAQTLVDFWLPDVKAKHAGKTQKALDQIQQWMVEGKLKPHVSKVVKMSEVNDELNALKAGQRGVGKAVLDVAGSF